MRSGAKEDASGTAVDAITAGRVNAANPTIPAMKVMIVMAKRRLIMVLDCKRNSLGLSF
jgi:hypothetical protein